MIVVVLHEPQDLVNIAHVVRGMKNFGFRDLRQSRRDCGSPSANKTRRRSRPPPVLENSRSEYEIPDRRSSEGG